MRNIIRREGKLLKDQSLDILMKEKKGRKKCFFSVCWTFKLLYYYSLSFHQSEYCVNDILIFHLNCRESKKERFKIIIRNLEIFGRYQFLFLLNFHKLNIANDINFFEIYIISKLIKKKKHYYSKEEIEEIFKIS